MILPAAKGRAKNLLSLTTPPKLETATQNDDRHANRRRGKDWVSALAKAKHSKAHSKLLLEPNSLQTQGGRPPFIGPRRITLAKLCLG